MDDFLVIRGLNKSFDGRHVLKDVNLSLPRGKLIGLIGPNGCGKSTLMKCVTKVYAKDSGQVIVDGVDLEGLRPSQVAKIISNVPAEYGNVYGMNVMDMVMLGRYPFVDHIWWETPEDEEMVREAMSTFGIDHLRGKQVSTLSSGERQRALIAKAYVQEPKLMMVDEPTSHLDIRYKLEVMEYLKSLTEKGMAVMVAEHDISLMARYCDICIIMKEGEVFKVGTPDKVITEQLMEEVYEIRTTIGLDREGEIYVLPKNFINAGLKTGGGE